MTIKLYKFQSFDDFCKYYKDSYMKNKVHFSKWDELNDPLEGYFYTFFAKIAQEVVGEKQKIRIMSLTSSFRNFPMWAYYGDNRKGVCLEYTVDTEQLPPDIELRKIKYVKKFPYINIKSSYAYARRVLSTKLCPWSGEKEFRLLSKRESNLISDNAIQLSAIILGDMAADKSLNRFKEIQKEFVDALGLSIPKFYQTNLLSESPFLDIEELLLQNNHLLSCNQTALGAMILSK